MVHPFGRPAQRAHDTTGVWRGVVTRIDGARTFIEVPRLARGREYGPVEQLQGPWTPNLRTEAESGGGGGDDAFASHSHDVGVDLAPGDRVLVGFIEGRQDEPVILGRLA